MASPHSDMPVEQATNSIRAATPSGSNVGGSNAALRISCQACATSKVKCPKEKPSCSRCESRGAICQYVVTRRPGRKRAGRDPGHMASSSTASTVFDSIANKTPSRRSSATRLMPRSSAESTVASATTTPNCLGASSPSPVITTLAGADAIFTADSLDAFCFSTEEEVAMIPELADFSTDVGDLDFLSSLSAIASPFDLYGPDLGSTIIPKGSDVGSLLMPPDNITSEFPSLETLLSADSHSASSLKHSLASYSSPPISRCSTSKADDVRFSSTLACGCLTQALDLLKTLSIVDCQTTFTTSGILTPTSPGTPGAVQTVLHENKQGIEAVLSRLACANCSDDVFLLSVLTITVQKILERYAIAARIRSGDLGGGGEAEAGKSATARHAVDDFLSNADRGAAKPLVLAGYGAGARLDQDDRERVAQLVLSELHRVQRLVNKLAPKLKGVRDADGDHASGPSDVLQRRQKVHRRKREDDLSPGVAFSEGTLEQMERDMRKSLSSLSTEIISRIRQSQF
ncbi:hypothetical protein J7T55_007805 [Diaporthe amygdali]|uniref:uncharacterized protein n=1 Tax=Phomopsis amygdali TaxID=1214568 RepID=UPI0022FEB076|nr:uncharacterized protein J7T55_007805 [Diaporthe amygdali]KAJ0107614.1 hypothetical protein J7T55_007805 [Diaporthe amygdali]